MSEVLASSGIPNGAANHFWASKVCTLPIELTLTEARMHLLGWLSNISTTTCPDVLCNLKAAYTNTHCAYRHTLATVFKTTDHMSWWNVFLIKFGNGSVSQVGLSLSPFCFRSVSDLTLDTSLDVKKRVYELRQNDNCLILGRALFVLNIGLPVWIKEIPSRQKASVTLERW